MEWLTYVIAAALLVGSLGLAVFLSLIWVGWWRQRRWPPDDD